MYVKSLRQSVGQSLEKTAGRRTLLSSPSIEDSGDKTMPPETCEPVEIHVLLGHKLLVLAFSPRGIHPEASIYPSTELAPQLAAVGRNGRPTRSAIPRLEYSGRGFTTVGLHCWDQTQSTLHRSRGASSPRLVG